MRKISSDKIRVAVVGAGSMANTVHYPSLASLHDVEIAGICDINPNVLNQTADKYGIKNRYSDYQKMVHEINPDAIYVLGQPQYLYDVWVWCLKQGLNLYTEKPMGLNLHQARSLAYLADKHECITQVSFQRRNSPMFQLLLEECRKQGPIVHAVCNFNKPGSGPFLDARDKMLDNCIHAIDILRWICGGNIVKIESVTKRIDVPNINFISATFHFDNGATGFLVNNEISGRRIFSAEMHAPNISVVAELEGKGYLYKADANTKFHYGPAEGIEYDAIEVAGSTENYIYGGYQAKHREFIDCLRSGTLPSSHFGDALKTMEAAEIILAQSLLNESSSLR